MKGPGIADEPPILSCLTPPFPCACAEGQCGSRILCLVPIPSVTLPVLSPPHSSVQCCTGLDQFHISTARISWAPLSDALGCWWELGRECHCAGNPETTPKTGKAPPCLLEKGSGYSLRGAEALWVPAAAFCCHGTLPWLSIFLLQLFFLCSTLPDLRICVGDPDERVGVFSIHMYSGTEEVQSHLTSSSLHSELLPRSLCLREVTEEQSISKGKDTSFTAWPAPGEALPLRVLSASHGVGYCGHRAAHPGPSQPGEQCGCTF